MQTNRKPWVDFERIVVEGGKFAVARAMADSGIPFAFVCEAGPNTVGDIRPSDAPKLADVYTAHPTMHMRHARWPWAD